MACLAMCRCADVLLHVQNAIPVSAFLLFQCQGSAMKFSRLAIVVTLLLQGFGEVGDDSHTHVQEEFAGVGNIVSAARLFRLAAARRDVSCLIFACVGSTGLRSLRH